MLAGLFKIASGNTHSPTNSATRKMIYTSTYIFGRQRQATKWNFISNLHSAHPSLRRSHTAGTHWSSHFVSCRRFAEHRTRTFPFSIQHGGSDGQNEKNPSNSPSAQKMCRGGWALGVQHYTSRLLLLAPKLRTFNISHSHEPSNWTTRNRFTCSF